LMHFVTYVLLGPFLRSSFFIFETFHFWSFSAVLRCIANWKNRKVFVSKVFLRSINKCKQFSALPHAFSRLCSHVI
jgi:hypothetical protein